LLITLTLLLLIKVNNIIKIGIYTYIINIYN